MQSEGISLPNFSLGWELEATHRAARIIEGVEVGHDGSVGGEHLEYRVKRENVFNANKSLTILRELATDPYLQVDRSCGFHVHVGLGKRMRKLHPWAGWFVTLAREVEEHAFKAVPQSRRQNDFCRSWRTLTGTVIAKEYAGSKGANPERYNWVNPVEVFRPGGIRTIEIRLMGDCRRYTYLLAWISACRIMAIEAWKLIYDPSRLAQSKEELKNTFSMITNLFLASCDEQTIASHVLALARKANLAHPFGNPLEALKGKENELELAKFMGDNDRREFVDLLRRMKGSVRDAREQARTQHVTPAGVLMPGDTVVCTTRPEDRVLVVGSAYRVTGIMDRNWVQVWGDHGNTVNVHVNNLRLIESAREPQLVS